MKDAPTMAVQVEKAVRIHEAQVLRLVMRRAARRQRFGDQAIHLLAALARERDQHFNRLARIANLFRREAAKPGVRQQHHMNRVTHHNARASVVAVLRVVCKAKRLEKSQRFRQVGDRQVEKDLSAHGFFLCFNGLDDMLCGLTKHIIKPVI